jgi:hypothetical protein
MPKKSRAAKNHQSNTSQKANGLRENGSKTYPP